jgi:hypothetical protein
MAGSSKKRGDSRQYKKASPNRPSRNSTPWRGIRRELAAYGGTFGVVTGFVGLLDLSPLTNILLVAGSLLVVFLFRRRTTYIILATLYSQSAFFAYFYAIVFLAVLAMVGWSTFAIGKKAGYTDGTRKVLASLNLPVRPLPPPRPRFPGDVNLDEYCRTLGPYTPFGPDEFTIVVSFEGGPTGSMALSDQQKQLMETIVGTPDFLICGSRVRQVTESQLVFRGYAAESRWLSRMSGNRSQMAWSG